MPPSQRSAKEVADFMSDLFSDFDANVTLPLSNKSAKSTLPSTPPRRKRNNSVSTVEVKKENVTHQNNAPKSFRAHGVDVSALLEGVEDWDWDDVGSAAGSPVKHKSPKPEVSGTTISDNISLMF